MNVLSLFDGMSCGQLALNRAGVKYDYYFASEINKPAIKVTQHNYPDTVQLGDITNIRADDLPQIDLLIGGSPCQGFSFGGKHLNFQDHRSGLVFEYLRLLQECKPTWFLLENVMMKKEYQDKISSLIGCYPILIDSAAFSGQSRKRLYWTSIPIHPYEDNGISCTDLLDNGWYASRKKSYCIDANYGKGPNLRRYLFCGSRQVAFKNGFIIPDSLTKEDANSFGAVHKDKWRILSPTECERLQTVPDGYTEVVSKAHRYRMLGNGWTVDVIAHIFRGLSNETN